MSLAPTTIHAAGPHSERPTAASFVPGAGMVCSSLTVSGVERLGQRKGLEAYARQGSTMGIPLLYPWANRLGGHGYAAAGTTVTLPHDPDRVHEEASGLPLHGITPGLMAWTVERAEEDRLLAGLDWAPGPLFALFPYRHRASFEAQLAPGSLTVTVTVAATGADRVPVSLGFHPYLALAGAERAGWEVVLPPCRGLRLDDRQLPTGERIPVPAGPLSLADRAFDDAYELDGDGARFLARAPGQTMAVELIEGFGFAQVFSPAGTEFVCFEPMTAPANALRSGDGLRVLDPGEAHRARFRITLAAAD